MTDEVTNAAAGTDQLSPAPAPVAAQSVLDRSATGSKPYPSPEAMDGLVLSRVFDTNTEEHNADLPPFADKPSEPSVHARARALVDGYEHALATNSPRTVAELAEIKALLDVA